MTALATEESSSTLRRATSHDGHFALIVAVLVFVVGVVSAVCVPAGAGLDEPMHVARVEQIAEGKLIPQEVDTEDLDTTLVAPSSDRYVAYGGQTDAALYELVARGNTVYFDAAEDGGQMGLAFPTWEDERLSTDARMGEGTVTWIFPNTAINSPVSYAPHVLAYLAATSLTSNPVAVVIAMRMAGVLTLTVAVWACLRLLPAGQCAFAVVALLPVGITVNSMVTADLMAFACSSVYLCCLLRMLLLGRAGRLEWAVLWPSLLCLCLCKTTYAPLGLLLLCLPAMDSAWRTPGSLMRIGAVGFTSLGAFLAWYLLVHDVNTGLMWSSDIDPDVQASYVLSNPLSFAGTVFVGAMRADTLVLSTWSSYTMLFSASWPTVLVLLVAFVMEFRRLFDAGFLGRRRSLVVALSLLLVVGIVVLLIYLALYLQFTPPGEWLVKGVQTRYFLPVVFPVLFALMVVCVGCSSPRAERYPLSARGLPVSSYVLMTVLMTALSALTVFSVVWTVF